VTIVKVLIAVDDSPWSQAAMDYVKKALWPRDTEMVVLSVARPAMVAYSLVDAPGAGATFSQELYEEQLKYHEEVAARHERQIHDLGFRTRAAVMAGDPREAILTTAAQENADLIVVGSHGRSGVTKLVMGSVASHVVTHAPCNVLVVKIPKKA
jgi:nucleotide-binding universal stress UspA family protein